MQFYLGVFNQYWYIWRVILSYYLSPAFMLNHCMQHYAKKLWKCFIFESNFRGNSLFLASFPCCQQREVSTHSTQPLPLSYRDSHSREEKENSSGSYGTAGVCGFNSGVVDSAVGQNCGICSTAQEGFGGFRLCRFLGHQIKYPEWLFWQEFNGPYAVFMKKKSGEKGNKDKKTPLTGRELQSNCWALKNNRHHHQYLIKKGPCEKCKI